MKAETNNITAGDGGLRAEGERRTLGVPRIRKDRSSPYPEAFGVNLWNSSPAAFSLVELLFVLAIISILAGLVVGTAKYASTKAATSRAQSEIAAIEMALEHYKNDNGAYPTTPSGRPTSASASPYGNSPTLYSALAGGPNFPKTYMKFSASQIRPIDLTTTNLVDPFGTPYNYYCTQPTQLDQTNSASFDLWSYGPSGTNNDPNMITNWKP
jgi:general secretion pathway protein G